MMKYLAQLTEVGNMGKYRRLRHDMLASACSDTAERKASAPTAAAQQCLSGAAEQS